MVAERGAIVILSVLSRLLVRCSHAGAYLERRDLLDDKGAVLVPRVMHMVCPDCRRSRPAIDRTPDEHARMKQVGQVQVSTARPAGNVVKIRRAK